MNSETRFVVDRQGDVSIIRFNDPATMNALTLQSVAEFRDILRVEQKQARALVLAGGERAFCSGFRLDHGLIRSAGQIDLGEELGGHINPLAQELHDLEIPLVTAVRGAAAGAGASLALMGDVIVAGRDAFFMQSFCHIGLVPDAGAPWLLARTVGRVRAMELMLLGERLPAAQAHDWGMVSRLVDGDDVDATAIEIATRLAKGSSSALRLIRQAGWAAQDLNFADELRHEAALQSQAGAHADFREGVAAFVAKRRPNFSAR